MAHERSNRAMKVGIAYEVDKKMEDNYDREDDAGTPKHMVNWMNGVLEGECDPIPSCEWKTLNTHLRDGVMLCRLVNKLLKADGKPPIVFQKKVMSPFVAMTNIENFNKGCMEYGLTKESSFQSGDLWEVRKGPFLNVLNCVHSLGFVIIHKFTEAPNKCGCMQRRVRPVRPPSPIRDFLVHLSLDASFDKTTAEV